MRSRDETQNPLLERIDPKIHKMPIFFMGFSDEALLRMEQPLNAQPDLTETEKEALVNSFYCLVHGHLQAPLEELLAIADRWNVSLDKRIAVGATTGRVDMIKHEFLAWKSQVTPPNPTDSEFKEFQDHFISTAIGMGDLALLDWMIEQLPDDVTLESIANEERPSYDNLLIIAARFDRLDMLKRLTAVTRIDVLLNGLSYKGFRMLTELMDEEPHLETFQHLVGILREQAPAAYKQVMEHNAQTILNNAMEKGHAEVFHYIVENSPTIKAEIEALVQYAVSVSESLQKPAPAGKPGNSRDAVMAFLPDNLILAAYVMVYLQKNEEPETLLKIPEMPAQILAAGEEHKLSLQEIAARTGNTTAAGLLAAATATVASTSHSKEASGYDPELSRLLRKLGLFVTPEDVLDAARGGPASRSGPASSSQPFPDDGDSSLGYSSDY